MHNENRFVPYDATELPVNTGPWLVFAPHADDESFGMGGTLAKAAAKGIQTHLVIMTDGALGGDQENLVTIRQQEACQAADVLGMEEPVFLGYRDRQLHLSTDAVNQVTDTIRHIKPAAVFFPGCFELHPDHRTTAALVWRALQELDNEQIVPVSYEVLVQSPVNTLVDISEHLDIKKKAIAVYTSQLNENRYLEIALAMNQLRTATLRGDISHAEGFYCYKYGDISLPFGDLIRAKITPYFEL